MRLSKLRPAMGCDLHDQCRYLRDKGEVMGEIVTYVDTTCARSFKVYMFPEPEQTDAQCEQLSQAIDAAVTNSHHFIVRLRPAPLTVQHTLY